MLIELHSLTSHSPANLNRDDLGRPKSAMFGGVNRARISSQAIKRSVRTSNYLEEKLEGNISTRSRQIPRMIFNRLNEELKGNEQLLEKACKAITGVLGKVDKKDELMTSQIVFLTAQEINSIMEYVRNLASGNPKDVEKQLKDKEFAKTAAEAIGLNRNPGDGVDMALFGRMTTDDANSFASVDAAMQVAHAISTHTVVPETDWFTAVDDVVRDEEERGSGHIGELEFNSATFYKYFSCNLPLLIQNMGGAAKEAVDALATVLDAACQVTPSGKQNSFASHALADTILIVARNRRIPVSLVNAFERPVPRNEEKGYLEQSRERLVGHYAQLVKSYQLADESAAFFCIDSDAAETLKAGLPEGTVVVGSIGELFEWMKKAAGEMS